MGGRKVRLLVSLATFTDVTVDRLLLIYPEAKFSFRYWSALTKQWKTSVAQLSISQTLLVLDHLEELKALYPREPLCCLSQSLCDEECWICMDESYCEITDPEERNKAILVKMAENIEHP